MKITYGKSMKSYGRQGTFFQDVFLEGIEEPVACLVSRSKGLLKPVKEYYQVLVADTEENRKYDFFDSEDEGFIFIAMNEEEFLEYLKGV